MSSRRDDIAFDLATEIKFECEVAIANILCGGKKPLLSKDDSDLNNKRRITKQFVEILPFDCIPNLRQEIIILFIIDGFTDFIAFKLCIFKVSTKIDRNLLEIT